MKNIRYLRNNGFTLVETMIGVVVTALILVAITSILMTMQKSSTRSTGYADAQQNTRSALDCVSDQLRQAGAGTNHIQGQQWLVHAAPYQVAINADLDNGQAVAGNPPLSAISVDHTPNTVPAGGTPIYTPSRNYSSGAETVVLTLDSDVDGSVSSSDRGDDQEENGLNQHLFNLKRYVYGYDGAGMNEVRTSDLALIRGPVPFPDGSNPAPLFQYYYDHDDNVATPDKLWGDNSPEDGTLNSGEIAALTQVPNNLLPRVRTIKITVIGESNKYDKRYEDNDGFLSVQMNSEVFLRNASRTSAVIYGKVFNDADGDEEIDQGESGIPDVEIQIVGASKSAVTDNFGNYNLTVNPGSYSVKEVDPYGYSSTTPNLVSVSVASRQAEQVNFGDVFTAGFGIIQGTVFEDLDENGIQDATEDGIEDVLLSLDTGEQVTTDENGNYAYTIPIGNYILTETDNDGYGSTTPNSVEVVISDSGDTVTVNFGDIMNPDMGAIEGYVFLDENEDGVRDNFEPGLASVSLHLSSGDSALTNADGYYQFSIPPGVYDLKEIDPDGYTSTTVNEHMDILIKPDTTVYRHFGDILDTEIDFVEIVIGDTERALCVRSMDFDEDNKNDPDIVLGTPFGNNSGNMLIYHNMWMNSNTALSKLFGSAPTYRRNAFSDINTISTSDLSGDDYWDVVTGQEYDAGKNILEWFNSSNPGVLSDSPDRLYSTSIGGYVMDSKLVDYNQDGILDLIVGLRSAMGTFTGAFQTFRGAAGGALTADQYITTAAEEIHLGEIWAVDTGDFDGDGDPDLVIGSHTNSFLGFIDIYLNGMSGKGSGNPGYFAWGARYMSAGAVNDIKVIDMMEDDQSDPDILAAISIHNGSGGVLLWNNDNGTFGKPDTTDYDFGAYVTPNWPHDAFNPQAACMTIDAAPINRDIFPDVVVGTRSSSFFTGDVFVLKTFGLLPTHGVQLNNASAGEVNTIDLADFNKDSALDVVIGTRTSATQGKLVIYFFSD